MSSDGILCQFPGTFRVISNLYCQLFANDGILCLCLCHFWSSASFSFLLHWLGPAL